MHFKHIFLAVVVGVLAVGCGTPRAVEEHHHHHYEADTLSVKSMIDRHVNSWHEQIDSAWRERVSQYLSQQQQSEQQHETVTETVTESVDSLGRRIRQEQRTITRDISRELQTIEQSITREYEQRLQSVTDSLDSAWQQCYDSLQARVSQMDSTFVKKTPVGDTRPWYRRLFDSLVLIVLGGILGAGAWLIFYGKKVKV